MTDANGGQALSGDFSSCSAKIDEIYNSWQFVGRDENANDTYLPLSRKSIKLSKSLSAAAKLLNPSKEEQEELKYINKVLKSSMKRKTRASWKVILICLGIAGWWGWELGAFSKPGEYILEKNDKELAEYFNKEKIRLQDWIKESVEIDLPETQAKIKEGEAKIKAGIENEQILEETKERLKKDKKHLKWLEKEYLPELSEDYERIKDMTVAEYKADYLAIAEKEQRDAWIAVAFYLIVVILYIITSRRPYFLFWKKGYEDGDLNIVDDVGAAVVSSALISGMVNFDRNSTEYVKWSDGSVTRETDLTGGGMGIIIGIVLVMLYIMFIIISMPLRIIWNYLRNYIIYF